MILGAGSYQKPLIEKAKEMGFYTVVCSIAGNYPGLALADKWCEVSTMNREACLEVARTEKVDGVVSCGSDGVLPTIGYINDALGLTGHSLNSAILATDKAAMKKAFIKHGVRTAPYYRVGSLAECKTRAAELSYPLVLKVVDSCGSKGVAIVKNEADLETAYASVKQYTELPYLVIEAFIEGTEFGAQAFVDDDTFTFTLPHGDKVYQAESGVPIGHFAPYDLPDAVIEDCREQLSRAVKALGINNAPINADFILKGNEVYVLEIAPRMGSTLLPELVSVHTGNDYYAFVLNHCMGGKPAWNPSKEKPCVVEVLISEKSGVVQDANLPDTTDHVNMASLLIRQGDAVNRFRTAYDRIGYVVATGKDLTAAENEITTLKSALKVEIKSDNGDRE